MGNEKKLVGSKNAAVASSPKNKTYTFTKVALIVIAIVLVATMALVFIANSGLILRSNVVLKSENFKVTGSMMQYMVNAQYQSFYSNYGAYGSSLFGIDFTKSIREQAIDTTKYAYVSVILGEDNKDFQGTWYDYFWMTSLQQMKNTLVFCEAAKAAGVELNDEDKTKIDDAINNLRANMDAENEEARKFYETYYGQKGHVAYKKFSDYLAACYGQGVNEKDVRKVLELFALSEKFYNSTSEEILNKLKEENGITEVNNYFNDKKDNYLKVDYLSFTFSASYVKPGTETEATKAEAWNKYLVAINEAMDHAKELAACETEEAFKTYMINYWFEDLWDTQYKKTIEELKKKKPADGGLTDTDIPAKEVIEEKKAKALADITDALLNGKEAYELAPSGKTAYDGAIDAVRENVFTTLKGSSYYGGLERIKMEYSDSNDKDKWTFDKDRKPGDNKYFASHDAEFIGGESTAPETTAPEATTPETTTPETTSAAAPAAETPAASTPVESTPAESTPVESTPAESTPVESTPVETTPAPDPNWEIEVDATKDDDKKFTVEVRFITESRYHIDQTVREFGHILITTSSIKAPAGETAYTEAQKHEKALKRAEDILAEFKAGEMNKETFEALANKKVDENDENSAVYNEDSNVFYSEVLYKDMVESVNNWLFAADRKVGDVEVVKSEYGYHVMYMVEISDKTPGWHVEARADLYAEKVEAWSDECQTKYAITEKKVDAVKNKIKLINE